MIKTKWSDNFNRLDPLPEYPRPQFVRDSYISLNGEWNYAVTRNSMIPHGTFDGCITVPYSPETPLSGVGRVLKPDEFLFYKKEFALEKGFNRGRVFINFGAVDQIADVFLNGKFVGRHVGGYTAFTMELTPFLVPEGETNTLVVRVKDCTDTGAFSRGKQKIKRGGIWYSAQSGIWQSVWLESTPIEYLEKIKITPDYDNSCVRFELFGTDSAKIRIYDEGRLVCETDGQQADIPDFKPWSPESPFLYDVQIDACGETIRSYFGMRKFSVGVDSDGIKRLFLNNKPYFHNGLLDQGYYPDGYLTPPSNAAMEHDVLFAKKAGFNMLRKHIKIEPLLWYHYCDVNGIIVWQDMVNGGGNYGLEVSVIPFVGITLDDSNYKLFHRDDAQGRSMYYNELKETIDQLYNCPCIAVWVPFNEGWGQFDSAKAYDMIKKLDETRIVDTTSGWHDLGSSDLISKHIYFTPIKVKQGDRPYVLSEFGGYSMKVKNHTFNKKMFGYKIYSSDKSLTNAYVRLFNNTIIPQIKDGLSATVYTQLTDVEDELNGLLTYDRKVEKIKAKTLKKINERVKI